MNFLKKELKEFYSWFFERPHVLLENELKDCESILDLGCGRHSPISKFKKKFMTVGVDADEKSIIASKERKIHDSYIVSNVLNVEEKIEPKSFDAVIALDIIEHLEKKDGLRLLEIMEKLARKKIILITPNGFLEQKEYYGNPLQQHKSGWVVEDFEKKGFKVYGINGLKGLKSGHAQPKYSPKILFHIVSDITQLLVVKNNPKKAFQLLCVKKLTNYV